MISIKITDKEIYMVKVGLQQFINHTNDYITACYKIDKKYYNMDYLEGVYEKNPEDFFQSIGTDKISFFDGYSRYQFCRLAEKILKEIENIHTNIIGICMNIPTKIEFVDIPTVKEWLECFKYFCFDDNNFEKLLSLEEQNKKLKTFKGFDASTKNPRTFKTQNL